MLALYSIPAYSTFFVVVPVAISENTYTSTRGLAMGLYSAVTYSGQALGTLIGAYMADFSGIIRFNFLIAGSISLFGLLIGILFYKENLSKNSSLA